MGLHVRRIYEPPQADDGYRVLVDRLWPRGLKKADAHVDLWLKEPAPSNELRQWFGHDPERWDGFRERYCKELAAGSEALEPVIRRLRAGDRVTLLYSARDEQHNNALVLRDFLQDGL